MVYFLDAVVQQVLDNARVIRVIVAAALNLFCAEHRLDCCAAVDQQPL